MAVTAKYDDLPIHGHLAHLFPELIDLAPDMLLYILADWLSQNCIIQSREPLNVHWKHV